MVSRCVKRAGLNSLLTGGVAALLVVAGTTTASAEEQPPTAVDAINAVAPEVFQDVAATESAGGTVAAEAEIVEAGLVISVPTDPAAGISVVGGGVDLGIGLPNGTKASPASVDGDGIVSYDNGDGSATVPVVKDDGSVQITTVIDGPDAPTRYAYPLDVPEGGSIEDAGNGMIAVLDQDGEFVAAVMPPWAKDANGNPVATHFEIDGDTLTQVVEHTAATAYPVAADPKFAWYGVLPSVKTTRSETSQLRGIGAGATGAAKYCAAFIKAAGIAGAVLCTANSISIMVNANRIYAEGKCAQLLIGPGAIGTIGYKDSYCR